MIFELLALAFMAWLWKDYFKDKRDFERWAKADAERDVMFKHLMELLEDCTMTEGKWREWLPVYEYVDDYYARNNTLGIELRKLAPIIRERIYD